MRYSSRVYLEHPRRVHEGSRIKISFDKKWYNKFMKKVNVPTSKMGKFEGKWVAINSKMKKIVAVGETLKDIQSLVVHSIKEKIDENKILTAFLVPRRDEGPFIL